MGYKIFLSSVCVVLAIGLLNASNAQPEAEGWIWWDFDNDIYTRAELDILIEKHKIWYQKIPKMIRENGIYEIPDQFVDDTLRLNLSRATLFRVNIPGVNLSGGNLTKVRMFEANLNEADLCNANLTEADLGNASLFGAYLDGANLTRAYLRGVNFSRAALREAVLTGADLCNANLLGANLSKANLTSANLHNAKLNLTNLSEVNLIGAGLSEANLTKSYLESVNLTGAYLEGTNLTGAILLAANLTGANLSQANLENVLFEPDSLPYPEDIAYALNLDRLRYIINPSPLVRLKQSLFDAGFKSQSKQVNTALQRVEASPIEYVLFDLTCEWGINPWRPLLILMLTWLIFGALYGMIETKYCHPNKYLIASKKGLLTELDTGSDEWRKPNNEWLAYGVAYLFSLHRALRIGFRELSASHWLMMLLPPDFEMKSRGWPRFVSGIQSLLSVALIALSLFSYFGRPFEF